MEKFTAGKWKTEATCFIGTDEEDTQTIAYVEDHRNRKMRPEQETAANARLIASAPDMYYALKGLVEFLDDTSPDDWRGICQDASPEPLVIANARKALKSATEISRED